MSAAATFFRGIIADAMSAAGEGRAARRRRPSEPDPWLERYSRQLVLPEWSEADRARWARRAC